MHQHNHSVICHLLLPYRKENDYVNDLCANCFEFAYLRYTGFIVYML
jgi:hypothetical protein